MRIGNGLIQIVIDQRCQVMIKMGTELIDSKDVQLLRFYGGDKRGVCYNLKTDCKGYTKEAMVILIGKLTREVLK